MRELFNDFAQWQRRGLRVAVARVIDVEGSGPREPGAAMAVAENGEVVGSVSGGCVEGAVVGEALAILAGEKAPGIITFIQPLDTYLADSSVQVLAERTSQQTPVGLATVIEGPHVGAWLIVSPQLTPIGSLGNIELDRIVGRDTLGELEAGTTGVRHYGADGQTTPEDLDDTPMVKIFVESFAPPPHMWIFGAVDFTAALARVAKILGYHVTVCDAREVFATRRRFPMADEVVVTWPNAYFESHGKSLTARDAVCVLTHDAKFDVPAIQGALSTKAGYIGVMGSRKTHTKRLERLALAGVTSPADLARLMSPIGLDLGARTPEETAISICAEIIAQRTGRQSPSLKDASGPIH